MLVGLDREGFSKWAKKLEAELKRDLRLINVSSDIQENGNAVLINTDRVIAGRLGVTMQSLNDTLYDAFGQRQVSTIYGQSNQYRVVLEVEPRFQTDIAALGSIYVPGNSIINRSGNSCQGLLQRRRRRYGFVDNCGSSNRAGARGAGSPLIFRDNRPDHCPAIGQSCAAISFGDHQLRRSARCFAGCRRAGRD